jgi:peptide/nickel transport system substrate-binding protein
MKTKRLLAALLAAGAVGALTATPTAAQDKVVFVYGATNEPSSINPMIGYKATDFYFWAWSYHLPISFGVDDLGAVPDIVTDIEVGEDGQTFTYTIDDGVTWSDGEPLTAEDVAFTLNLYKDKNAYLPQNYLKLLDRIEAVDDTHVELHSTQPTSLFSGEVPYLYTYILPEHVWSQYDEPKKERNVPMVSSGPFMVTEYERGQFVRLERNPFWTGPEPGMDEIIYRIYENEDAEAAALLQGEIDFAYIDSPAVFESLEGQENIGTMAGTIPEFDELAMNTGSSTQPAAEGFTPHGDGHPALADPVVRRAIRMSIDSETLVDRVLLGYGLPGDSIVPPVSIEGARWVPSGDQVIGFDLPGAAQLLEDAGYIDTDGDGVREMPGGGQPLEFRYYVQTDDRNTSRAAPFVQEWLAEVGIATEVTAMTSGRLTDQINAGTYDLFHWGWIPDPDPDSILSYFQCNQRPPDGNTYGNNDAYYCNPEYDALYEEQRSTGDPAARLDLIHQMQELFYEEAPYVVLWYPPTLQAYRTDRFEGYRPQPAPAGDLLNGYSRDAVLTIRPVGSTPDGGETVEPGETGDGGETAAPPDDGSTSTRGISAGVWAAIGAVVVVALVVVLLLRRRSGAEDRE